MTPANEGAMEDDFDNGMGLPEDELTGSTSMSDPNDLGLGGMDAEDEMDSEAPGRPSRGARAEGAPGWRARKPAARAARKSASGGAKKAKKKSPGRTKNKTSKKSAR